MIKYFTVLVKKKTKRIYLIIIILDMGNKSNINKQKIVISTKSKLAHKII